MLNYIFFFSDQAACDSSAPVPAYGVLQESGTEMRGEESGRSDPDVHGGLEFPEFPGGTGKEPHPVHLPATGRQRHQVGPKAKSVV